MATDRRYKRLVFVDCQLAVEEDKMKGPTKAGMTGACTTLNRSEALRRIEIAPVHLLHHRVAGGALGSFKFPVQYFDAHQGKA
jgi:hypothetical protein